MRFSWPLYTSAFRGAREITVAHPMLLCAQVAKKRRRNKAECEPKERGPKRDAAHTRICQNSTIVKTQPVQARERLILRAESLDDEGRAIAPHEGGEVIAPGLFVGELAEIEIEAVSRQHPRAFGSVIRHLEDRQS